ncbi:metal-dependent hydrolase [Paraclostridium sordellii]|uniref:metal-dependent hydrolase n=1 Tax=Paraclostridium sordellii TaxID=1505 RepID=UPI0005E6F7AD|nr:metal-dependent hydrolase [Paeniclostridium sordellii]CEP79585.1 membrane protein [[Clostridium] sordellii] [Paeniclostridium sordellii]
MRGKTHFTIGVLTSLQASMLFNKPLSLMDIAVCSLFSILPDLDTSNSIISNTILNHNVSKKIYKIIIYAVNILIFLISIKINDNFIISSLVTFIAIVILEAKISHGFLRRLFLSLIFILLTISIYLINGKFYFILFTLILASFPWLKHRKLSHSLLAIFIIGFVLKQIELITNISNLCFFGTIGYSSHLFLGDLFTKSGIPLFYPFSEKKFSLGFLKVGGSLSNFLEIVFVIFLFCLILLTLIKF